MNFLERSRIVNNARGSIILQVLAAAAAMGIGFYFLTTYVIGQKQQIGKTINAVSLRFALNSTMDYVLFGVRQKYCFTDDGLLMNAAPVCDASSGSSCAPTDPKYCSLVNTGSVERLLMSADTLKFIKELHAMGKDVGPTPASDDDIPLSSISRYLKIDSVTAAHPLFPVLQKLVTVKDDRTGQVIKVDGISVDMQRNNSPYLPRAGREVYLTVKVSLKGSQGDANAIQIGNTTLSIISQIAIFPREIGSFALLVPQDLHLDTTSGASMSQGDVTMHMYSSRKELANSAGLVFTSPVYVNRDLYLPKDSTDPKATADTTNYSPVTFADRLYLGNGAVKVTGGDLYAPRTAGGLSDRFWSDSRTFGGFLKGIENDGGLDRGLQVFGKISSGDISVSPDLMSKCSNRALQLASKSYLQSAALGATLASSSANAFKYTMFLSKGDQFSTQGAASGVDTSNWGAGKAVRSNDGKTGVIASLTVTLGDYVVESDMTGNSTLKLTPEVGSANLLNQYNGAVTAAQTQKDQAQAKLDSLNSSLSKANKDLQTAQDALSDEQSKPVKPADAADPSATPSSGSSGGSSSSTTYQDPSKIKSLTSQISSLQSQITELKQTDIPNQQTAVSNASTSVDSAKADLESYGDLAANPPVVTIQMLPVKTGKKAPNDIYTDRYEMDVSFTNIGSLVDSKGHPILPSIGFQAYDATYSNGNPILVNAGDVVNTKLMGYLNFTKSGNKLVGPGNVADSSATIDNDDALLDQQCALARSTAYSSSFGGAGWATDFSGATRTSWNFAGDAGEAAGQDPVLNVLDITDSRSTSVAFHVKSIVGQCNIKATADFVTGFFACDKLVIEARSKPLRIIGTFIAGDVRIDPTAFKAGIQWSSIYYPQATRELRQVKVLGSFTGRSCDALTTPIWHPIPGLQDVSDRMACNAISLRAKADPFQWTAVDPDCGIADSSQPTTSCKRRLIRFFVVEQSREGGV